MRALLISLCCLLFGVPVVAQEGIACPAGEPTLTIASGAVGQELDVLNQQLEQYMSQCPNVTVDVLEARSSVSDRIGLYQQFLDAGSNAVDIFAVDVIWAAIMADYMVDMRRYAGPAVLDAHLEILVENNTVDDRLVALPWFVDTGLLYYRTDLLEQYAIEPPETWDALETAARTIQQRERERGNADFWGYVWQGAPGESTVANALEWQAAAGGGTIISPTGDVQVNNAATIRVLERAAAWIGEDGISPPAVLTYGPEESRLFWEQGNAAFMRNWTYAYALGNRDESRIQGQFATAPLPAGTARRASTLGGWSLAVSRYSTNPDAAAALVLFLASPEQQRFRAEVGGFSPTILSVYESADLVQTSPYFEQMLQTLQSGSTVTRPSTLAADRYTRVSRLYTNAVHSVLRGNQNAAAAMDELAFELENIVIELGY